MDTSPADVPGIERLKRDLQVDLDKYPFKKTEWDPANHIKYLNRDYFKKTDRNGIVNAAIDIIHELLVNGSGTICPRCDQYELEIFIARDSGKLYFECPVCANLIDDQGERPDPIPSLDYPTLDELDKYRAQYEGLEDRLEYPVYYKTLKERLELNRGCGRFHFF